MNKADQRRAWKQAATCLTALVVVLYGVFVVQQRPAKADELKIPIAVLRSDAAELLLLGEQSEHLPTRFASAHRRQLLENIGSTQQELDDLHLHDTALDRLRSEAREHAAELARDADRIVRDRRDVGEGLGLLRARQQQLKRAEADLTR